MNKRCLFRGLDLVTYFNIFLFSYLTITGFKENIGLGFIFLGLTLFNIAYLFTNIRNRIKISQLNEKRIELELKMEELLSKEQKIDINLIKQKMLEGRIESEIINNFPNAKIIKNAYIPIGNELYNEIDLIIIDEKGIFIK